MALNKREQFASTGRDETRQMFVRREIVMTLTDQTLSQYRREWPKNTPVARQGSTHHIFYPGGAMEYEVDQDTPAVNGDLIQIEIDQVVTANLIYPPTQAAIQAACDAAFGAGNVLVGGDLQSLTMFNLYGKYRGLDPQIEINVTGTGTFTVTPTTSPIQSQDQIIGFLTEPVTILNGQDVLAHVAVECVIDRHAIYAPVLGEASFSDTYDMNSLFGVNQSIADARKRGLIIQGTRQA